MIDSYFLILSFTSTLNEWNEKLNSFFDGNLNDVWSGALIFGVLMFLGFIVIGKFSELILVVMEV